MYSITGLCPRTDIDMGRHGFWITLHPEFKEYVRRSGIDERRVGEVVKEQQVEWLKACRYDPELYKHGGIRVTWGEWGPEHITVPGNACGLDIDRQSFGCVFRGGINLCPHNIDSWSQVQLLLITFTFFADHVLWMGSPKEATDHPQPQPASDEREER